MIKNPKSTLLTQNNLLKWESLSISDDFIFSKVMRDEDICKELIEILLDLKVSKIKYLEEQKSIDINYNSKSIRLDVFVEDSDKIYNLEMQTSNNKELPKRTRYYQGLLDLNSIEKGHSYKNLKESYIIFICTFDLFKKGLPKYTFEYSCKEDNSIKLNDGAYKLFFNTNSYSKTHNQNLNLFLKYVNGNAELDDLNNLFLKKIDQKIKNIKINKEWRREFMTLLMREQEIAEEKFAQGKLEGKLAEKIEIAKNSLDILDNDTIIKITGLDLQEVINLRNSNLS